MAPADLSTPNLYLAANTLSAGQSYTFQITILDVFNPVNNTARVVVSVPASPLYASIAGGDREVSTNDAVLLDGSQSEDPDYTGTSPDPDLLFTWSCLQQANAGAALLPCAGLSTDPALQSLSLSSSLSVPEDQMEDGVSYLFTLQVKKGARKDVLFDHHVSLGVNVTIWTIGGNQMSCHYAKFPCRATYASKAAPAKLNIHH